MKAKIPLILRYHRLMDVFTKSNDERDFYLDRDEGFLLYVDLDKEEAALKTLEEEIKKNLSRYCLIPKMTFFEVKKLMEGFVHEKVYDIDTKEKLLDIIGAKEPRENFLEFLYDHIHELEKWQQYYQERLRIRIIEWLRQNQIQFVFEEDLDIPRSVVEKLKRTIFDNKVPKDFASAREALFHKAKIYYSNEALNPKPKRGRPPKQVEKVSIEPQFTIDVYTSVSPVSRPFLYIPDITSAASITFSTKFETEERLLALRGSVRKKVDEKLEALAQRLESLQKLSSRFSLMERELLPKATKSLFPLPRPKLSVKATEGAPPKEKAKKISLAIQEILPTKKKKEKPSEEAPPQKKKPAFSVKKVTPIKGSSKKKS